MTQQSSDSENVETVSTISADVAEAKKSLVERFNTAIRKPATMLIAVGCAY